MFPYSDILFMIKYVNVLYELMCDSVYSHLHLKSCVVYVTCRPTFYDDCHLFLLMLSI